MSSYWRDCNVCGQKILMAQNHYGVWQPLEPTSCTTYLPPAPDGSRYLVTSVVLNGQTVPRDPQHMSGWDFTNPGDTMLQFYGPWCQLLTDTRRSEVDIYYACDTR